MSGIQDIYCMVADLFAQGEDGESLGSEDSEDEDEDEEEDEDEVGEVI